MRHVILVVMGAALCAAPVARTEESTTTLQAIGMGRALYLTNCAQCHGADARGASLAAPGNGQATSAPDLTAIERRNGRFDPVHVAYQIKGRASVDCTSGMPCWEYLSGEPRGRAYTNLQTWKVVKYLQFVQQPAR